MSADHPLNLRVAYTVIKHGFHHSTTEGFKAIVGEVNNVFIRAREIFTPEKPFSDFTYEIIEGRLHWPDDEKSVEYHYRARISWLKDNGGTEEQINHARLELASFLVTQNRALELNDNEAVNWLSQKTIDPADGVAAQQIRREGDKLIHSSQLLPFDQQSQIDAFIGRVGEGRENISVDNSVGGWIVQGKALGYNQELSNLVAQSLVEPMVAELPLIGWQESVTPVFAAPLATISRQSVETPTAIEDKVASNEPSSFWWQLLSKQAAEPSRSDPEVASNEQVKPTRLDLVGVEGVKTADVVRPSRIVLEGRVKVITPRREVSEVPTRMIPVGMEKPATAVAEVSIPKTKKIEKRKTAEPTKTVFVGKQVPTRMILEGKVKTAGRVPEVKKRGVVFRALEWRAKKEKVKAATTKKEPPIYELPQIKLYPEILNEKEIPVWQPNLTADVDENYAVVLFTVLTFLLIVNTKWLQSDEMRGSGNRLVRPVFSQS